MIENNEIIDFSKAPTTFTSNKYYIESSSKGCDFNLVSKNQIEENNQNIILNFIEKNNENKKINAKCTLSNDNKNNIPCSLTEDITDKKYSLDSYIGSNENGVFYLIQDKDDFELSCHEENSDKSKKTVYIIIGVVVGLIIIAIIITIIVCFNKKKENGSIGQSSANQIIPIPFNDNSSSARSKNYNKNNII